MDDAFLEDFYFDVSFFGSDHCDDLAAFDQGPWRDLPFEQLA